MGGWVGQRVTSVGDRVGVGTTGLQLGNYHIDAAGIDSALEESGSVGAEGVYRNRSGRIEVYVQIRSPQVGVDRVPVAGKSVGPCQRWADGGGGCVEVGSLCGGETLDVGGVHVGSRPWISKSVALNAESTGVFGSRGHSLRRVSVFEYQLELNVETHSGSNVELGKEANEILSGSGAGLNQNSVVGKGPRGKSSSADSVNDRGRGWNGKRIGPSYALAVHVVGLEGGIGVRAKGVVWTCPAAGAQELCQEEVVVVLRAQVCVQGWKTELDLCGCSSVCWKSADGSWGCQGLRSVLHWLSSLGGPSSSAKTIVVWTLNEDIVVLVVRKVCSGGVRGYGDVEDDELWGGVNVVYGTSPEGSKLSTRKSYFDVVSSTDGAGGCKGVVEARARDGWGAELEGEGWNRAGGSECETVEGEDKVVVIGRGSKVGVTTGADCHLHVCIGYLLNKEVSNLCVAVT